MLYVFRELVFIYILICWNSRFKLINNSLNSTISMSISEEDKIGLAGLVEKIIKELNIYLHDREL